MSDSEARREASADEDQSPPQAAPVDDRGDDIRGDFDAPRSPSPLIVGIDPATQPQPGKSLDE